MESQPKMDSVQDRIRKYFENTDMETHAFNFGSYEEAKQKADEINAEYEGIAFVAKDGDRFAVKFRTLQLGEGIPEYHPDVTDLEQAA